MALVDNAVYVNGHRCADPTSLEETYEVLGERPGLAWIGLDRPDAEEIRSVANEFTGMASRSRTLSRPISAPSSSAVTARCSSSYARRARGGTRRRHGD
jgi:hypothetical protein